MEMYGSVKRQLSEGSDRLVDFHLRKAIPWNTCTWIQWVRKHRQQYSTCGLDISRWFRNCSYSCGLVTRFRICTRKAISRQHQRQGSK